MKERVNPPKPTLDDLTNVGRTNNGDDQRTREYTDSDGHTSKDESRNDGTQSNMAETEPDRRQTHNGVNQTNIDK